MRIIIVAYINSEKLLGQIEGIMSYGKFQTTETNLHYRVFTGHYNGHAVVYFKQLFKQLEDFEFNVEDSIFMVYPSLTENKACTISTLVLKRKGNKHLRRLEYR